MLNWINWFPKKKMAEKQTEDPEGFTCSKCRNVIIPYNKELKCPNCDAETKNEE